MDADLAALEEKIRQATELAKRLRAENVDLRQRLAALESDRRRLAEKVETAAGRIEGLMKQIPE